METKGTFGPYNWEIPTTPEFQQYAKKFYADVNQLCRETAMLHAAQSSPTYDPYVWIDPFEGRD